MASIKYDLPLIPLRDVVVFPGVVSTLFVGRDKSVNAIEQVMSGDKKIKLIGDKSLSKRDFARVINPLKNFGANFS